MPNIDSNDINNSGVGSPGDAPGSKPGLAIPPPPVHALSALITVALEKLWDGKIQSVLSYFTKQPVEELEISVAIVFAIGVATAAAVWLVQRYLAHDEMMPAVAKAMALSIIAASPEYSGGGLIGMAFLAWAGLSGLNIGLPGR